MLSYQHGYHAGGPADVHKHAVLAALLAHLTAKDKPLTYMETHAGAGLYDLSSPESLKTGEAAQGIDRALAEGLLSAGHPYRIALDAVRARFGAAAYPGSPMLARTLLRADDHLHLMELHPGEHAALRRAMRGSGAHVHRRDGYEGVLALSPPKPRRGLVLIDPSYEVKAEYGAAGEFAVRLHAKWPEAVIVIWYPLLPAGLHRALCADVEAAGLPRFVRTEVVFADPASTRGMHGDGLMVVNLPHGSAPALDVAAAMVPGRRFVEQFGEAHG